MNHTYKVRTEIRPQALQGLSENLLAQHWALYEGYVRNVNILREKLDALSAKGDFGPEFSELTRRLGFEFNGMVLHERYFSVMKAGQAPLAEGSELMKQLKKRFGGFDAWKREFSGMGKMRGIGWVVLYYDPSADVMSNYWINLHEDGHPAGCVPVLAMDVWEHAYVLEYGAAGRAQYIEAFFKNVDWARVESEFKAAVGVAASSVR